MLIPPPRNRLNHAGVHGGDEIDRGVEVFTRHSGFQRPLDATLRSRLAAATHHHREADERLLAIGQALDRMGIAIEGSKICFSHYQRSLGVRINGSEV